MKKGLFFIVAMLVFPLPGRGAWFGERPASFAELVKRVKPAVVNISTTKRIKRPRFQMPPSPFGGADPFEEFRRFFEDMVPREEERTALGSGCIINKRGDILTNNHVIGDADEILVKLADGRKFKAEVVGRDEMTDLAVIKIMAKEELPFVPLGDSDAVQPGDWAIAMGNPFGFEHTVTAGVISAKGRLVGDPKAPMTRFLQTDASINPGNSGGPLFDLKGEVIGINTMIYGMGTGIGFAIPSNMASALLPQLIEKGHVTRGWLGVQIQRLTPELAESYGLEKEEGALIGSVFPDSPAMAGGLRPGDIIADYDGKKIVEPFDLSTFVGQTPVGKTVELTVLRGGKKETVRVKIGKREDNGPGVRPSEKEEEEGAAEADLLGLAVRNMKPSEREGAGSVKGVVIERVEPGSNAERYDIREGDLLLEVNGKSCETAETYNLATAKLKTGDLVRLLIMRGEATLFVAFRVQE